MKKIAIVLTVMLLILTIPSMGQVKISKAQTTYGWPMFHHDNKHTGYTNSPTPNSNATFWVHEPENNYTSFNSPAVADGKVFFGLTSTVSNDGYVYCLDESTGKVKYSYKTGDGVYATPAVADGKVFFGCEDNYVYCLNENTMELVWKNKTGGSIYSSPAVAYGKVFIGSDDTALYCLDENTGKILWNFKTWGGRVFSSPAVADGKVFFGSCNNYIYCINASNGYSIWEYETGSPVESSPAVADGKVFVGSDDTYVYCLDENNGGLVWKYKTEDISESVSFVLSSPAVAYSKVFVGAGNAYVYCLDENNGGLVWKYKTGHSVYSDPAVADNKVFFVSSDFLYCLSSNTGDVIWKYYIKTSGGSPAVADGIVFIGDQKAVYAFGTYTPQRPATKMNIEGVSGKDWNVIDIPFDYEGAIDYIKNFTKLGNPAGNFGSIELNMTLKNTGNEKAYGVHIRGNVKGHIVMIVFDKENAEKDYVVVYPLGINPFDYPFDLYVKDMIDVSNTQTFNVEVPINYMTLLVGPFKVWESEQEDTTINVMFAIGQYEITLETYGDNFDTVKFPQTLKKYAIGSNANDMLEQLNEALAERVKDEEQKAVIERYMSMMNLDKKDYTINIPGSSRVDTTIPQDAKSMTITTVLPQGATLTKFLITIGATAIAIPMTSLTGISGITTFIIKPPTLKIGENLRIELETSNIAYSSYFVASQQTTGKLTISTVKSGIIQPKSPFDTTMILAIILVVIIMVVIAAIALMRKKKPHK